MPTTTKEVKFNCANCRREYRWKPELAGKQAKCKCGAVMTVPKTPPPPPAPREDDAGGMDDLYALAQEEKKTARAAAAAPIDPSAAGYRCPSCGSQMPVGSLVCAACTLDLRTGARANAGGPAGGGAAAAAFGYAGAHKSGVAAAAATRAPRSSDDMIYEGGKAISLYLPLGLIILGILFYFASFAMAKNKMGAGLIIFFVGLRVIMDSGFMLVALLLTAKFLDTGYGAFGPAVLKIIAIAIGPGALAAMLSVMISEGRGGIWISSGMSITLYFLLIQLLFRLDFGETLIIVGIIYAAQWLGSVILAVAIAGIIASGGGGAGVATGVGAVAIGAATADERAINADGPRPPTPEEIRASLDEHASLILNGVRGGQEPLSFLEGGQDLVLSGMNNAESIALIKSIQAAGAKSVMIVHIHDTPTLHSVTRLVVELPEAKPARKAVFDLYAATIKKLKMKNEEVPDDVGQTYLIWELPSPFRGRGGDDAADDEDEEDAPPAGAKAPSPARPGSADAPSPAPAEGTPADAATDPSAEKPAESPVQPAPDPSEAPAPF